MCSPIRWISLFRPNPSHQESSLKMNPNTSLQVKLLIDKKGQRVLFAEANEEFVDFLGNLLFLPITTVNWLLKGSFGTLHQSIKNLTNNYAAEPNINNIEAFLKLKPTTTSSNRETTPPPAEPKKMYICGSNLPKCGYRENAFSRLMGSPNDREPVVSDDPQSRCPFCDKLMSKEMIYIGQPFPVVKAGGVGCPASSSAAAVNNNHGGHNKGEVLYIIMDDLEVKPMSAVSAIFMLNSLNVEEIADLEEKIVPVGINEVYIYTHTCMHLYILFLS